MKCLVFRLPMAGAAAILTSTLAVTSLARAEPSLLVQHLASDVQLSADGRYVETIHSEIHINNEAGALAEGQKAIPYVASMTKVQIVSAYTLKKDGHKIPVDPSAIRDQPLPGLSQVPLFSDQRTKVILFPQLAPGDTTVYTVKVQVTQPYFAHQFIFGDFYPRSLAFQDVRESVTAPAAMALNVENHGVAFQREQHGSSVVYRWHYSAPIPAVEQPALVSPLDRTPRFLVSSFKDYASLGNAYAAAAAPEETVTPKIRATADQVTRGISDRRAQAQKLYEWVAQHVRYVAIQLGRGSFVPHSADSVLANGYGDCKDHTVLLAALLKAKGIESQSVLINAGNAYTLSSVPTFFQLNHAITFLPEFKLFVDSTAMVAPFGVLPSTEYGKPAVLVKPAASRLGSVPVLAAGVSNVTTRTVARIDASGALVGTTDTKASGPPSIILRLAAIGIQALGPDAASKQLASLGYGDGTGSFQMSSPVSLVPDYAVKGTFSVPGWLEANVDRFYLPGGLRVLSYSGDGLMGPIFSTKSTDDEATACFSGHASESLSLRIPPKYHVEHLPADASVHTANLTYTSHWGMAGQTLSVQRDFSSRISQPLCSGAVRKQVAAALKQIADDYSTHLSLTGGDDIKPEASSAPPGAIDAFNKGLVAAKQRQFKTAQQLFSTALRSQASFSPDQLYTLHLDRALTYAMDREYSAAIDDVTTAIRLKPEEGRSYMLRASLYGQLHQGSFALADMDKAVELSSGDLRVHMARAQLAMQLGKYATAIQDYTVDLRFNPSDPTAFTMRGMAYRDSGDFDHAAQDFNRAIALHSDDSILPAYLCQALARSKNPGAAFGQCNAVLKAEPYSAIAYEARGYARYRLKQYAAAVTDFAAASRIYPTKPDYLFETGVAKIKAGDRKGGSQALAQAQMLQPKIAAVMAKWGLAP